MAGQRIDGRTTVISRIAGPVLLAGGLALTVAGAVVFVNGELDTGDYVSLGLGVTSAIATIVYVLQDDEPSDS